MRWANYRPGFSGRAAGIVLTIPAMADPTFNEQMVTRLQALLLENVGADTVTVDGVTVQYADLQQRLDYFEKRLAVEQGTRPRAARIHLGGF